MIVHYQIAWTFLSLLRIVQKMGMPNFFSKVNKYADINMFVDLNSKILTVCTSSVMVVE